MGVIGKRHEQRKTTILVVVEHGRNEASEEVDVAGVIIVVEVRRTRPIVAERTCVVEVGTIATACGRKEHILTIFTCYEVTIYRIAFLQISVYWLSGSDVILL